MAWKILKENETKGVKSILYSLVFYMGDNNTILGAHVYRGYSSPFRLSMEDFQKLD